LTAPLAPSPGDQAKVTVTVGVDPDTAFDLFTREIDQWWRRGPRFRNATGGSGIIAIEPGEGGRVFESFDTGDREHVIEIGRTRIWDPPRRLVFEWRNSNFAPGEHTEVEVAFEKTSSGTRVTVTHRGWSRIRSDHPVRHGLVGADFSRMIGLWWSDQMSSMRLCCEGRRPRDRQA
jgi:uncharacterized protein YndB with AHSA1/START domain